MNTVFANRLSIVWLVIFCFISIQYWPSWAKELSYFVTDKQVSALHKLGYHHPISEDVVVVEVDDKSINEIGRWPWSRDVTAKLFSNLSAASIVVADMVFSEPSTVEHDQILANALMDADNVILGFFLRGATDHYQENNAYQNIESCALQRVKMLSGSVDLPTVENAEINIPLIADSALTCALFTVTPDSDGIYRRYPLIYLYKDLLMPTLAVQAFQYDTNQELNVVLDQQGIQSMTGQGLSVFQQNNLLLNFPAQIPTLSASDVIAGKVPAEQLQGKTVLIGLSEIGLFDLRPTSLDPFMPGVHLHATAVSNLKQDNWLKIAESLSLIIAVVSIIIFANIARVFAYSGWRWLVYGTYIVALFVATSWGIYKYHTVVLTMEVLFYTLLCLLLIEGRKFLSVQRQYSSVKDAFSSYVVPEVVDTIVEQGIKAEQKGVIKTTTVMFTDIQDFTRMSESLQPEQIIKLLNTVFAPVTDCITKNQGMLDKYIGDEVMALFNAPMDVDDFANKTVESAIAIQQSLTAINQQLVNQDLPIIKLSLGMALGDVTLGNMGSKIRLSYTAIGNTVNLASRLTALSKLYGQQMLISETLYQQLGENNKQRFQFIDDIIVKGRSSATKIYGIENVELVLSEQTQQGYQQAYSLYQQGQFELAQQGFAELAGDNNAAKFMVSRCQMLATSEQKDWQGIYQFDHK